MLHRLATLPRLPLIAALVGMVLCLPAVGTGLVGDDYLWWLILQGRQPYSGDLHPIQHIYNFIPGGVDLQTLRGAGLVTWWADPDLRIALARPLTAATFVLDHALFPRAFWLQHLHSVAWYGLGITAVAAVFRKVHGPTVAGLAALIFAVEDAHAMNAGWIANRHALISLLFGALGFLAHLRWRRAGGPWWLAALALSALGLLAGETALGGLAWIAAWQLTVDRKPAPLAPYALLIVAWRLAYDALGYGIVGSDLYIDPRHEPIAFAIALFERLPQLMLGQWLGAPIDAIPFAPSSLRWGAALAGLATIAALAWLVWPLLCRSAEARFWTLAMGLAAIPLAAAFPMDRLLVFAGVGAAGLLALLAREAGLLGHAPAVGPGRRRVTTALLVLHLPVSAVLLAGRCATLGVFGAFFGAGDATAPDDPAVEHQTFVWVSGHEFPVAYTPIMRLARDRPAPGRTALLASFASSNHITREDVDTLVIAPEGGFLRVISDRLERRSSTRSEAGQTMELPDFTAEVREITADGRPSVVAFHFHEALDAPRYRWLQWSPAGAAPFALPEIGHSVVTPGLTTAALFPVERAAR